MVVPAPVASLISEVGGLGVPGRLLTERQECRKCGETKIRDDFYPRSDRPGSVKSTCKSCDLARNRTWHENNRGHRAAYARQRALAAFGMTEADYDALLTSQGGGCAICQEPVRDRANNRQGPKALAVDHCHATGRVRGILCSNCNTLLGLAKDDADRLRAAIQYLESRS